MARFLYHLALVSEWDAAVATGSYEVSTRGRTLAQEGFIHLAFQDQVAGVAGRYYADVDEPVVLLTIELNKVDSEIKLEVPPGAPQAYPHLYGPLLPSWVVDVSPYTVGTSSGPTKQAH